MTTNQVSEEFPGRKGKGCHFSEPVILGIVKQVENGLRRSVIVEQYRISRTTIAEWMRDYGSAAYNVGRKKHLGQANRTSILRAILDGRMTVREAMIAYRVSGATIHGWIKAYKREKGELAPVMRTKKTSLDKPIEDSPEKKIEALEQALRQSQLQVHALNTLIDVAEDKFKIEIRKKAGANRSSN
jgi:transposase